jgi:hypothetical protein
MKNYNFKKIIILFVLALAPLLSKAQVQWYASSGPTTQVTDMNVCGDTTFSVYIYNPTTTTLLNNLIDIDLPTGVEYIGGSVLETTTATGLKNVVESNISDLGRPYFSFDSIPSNDWVSFTYRVHTQCGVSGNSIPIPITLSFNGGSDSPFGLNAVNINSATINIVGATNQNITSDIGTNYQQTITLRNAGLGYLDSLTDDLEVKVLLDATSCLSITAPDKGTLSGDTLILPKSIFATIGDNDGKWENNEDIQVTYTVSVSCCDNLSRNIQAYWGCDGNICETTSSFPSSVVIPNNIPNLNVTMPVVDLDYCFNGDDGWGTNNSLKQQIRIINSGGGNAMNLKLTLSSYIPGSGEGHNVIDTSGWVLRNAAGDSIGLFTNYNPISTVTTIKTTSCSNYLRARNIEADFSGISVPAGDTVYIEFDTYSENVSCYNSCGGNYPWVKFAAALDYQGPCMSTNYNRPIKNLFNKTIVLLDNTSEMPTDLFDGQTFNLSVDYSRYSTGMKNAADGKSYWFVPLAGKGLAINGTPTLERLGTTTPVANLNSFVQNDTLFIELVPNVSWQGTQLTIPMIASCVDGGGTKSINFGHRTWYDTTCANPAFWYSHCNNNTYTIHCPEPCPTGGATPRRFSLTRINLGQGDTNNDGKPDGAIDSTKINVHHAINGDTLLGRWEIYVNPNVEPANPNVGLDFPYTFIEFDLETPSGGNNTATTALTALPNASVTVYPNGNGAPINCIVTPTVMGQIATYDLSACKNPLAGGDSIVVEALYIANGSLDNGGFKNYVTDNDVYSSYTATPAQTYATVDSINGERHTCDRYNDYMQIYNIYSSKFTRNPQVKAISGCDNLLEFNFRRYINVQASNVWFPYEYRFVDVVDTFFVRISPSLEYRPGSARLNDGTTGGVNANGTIIPDAQIYRDGAHLVFANLKTLYTPYGGTIVPQDEVESTAQLAFSVDPTCDAVPGTTIPTRFGVAVAGNGVNIPTTYNHAFNYGSTYPGGNADSSAIVNFPYDAAIPFTTGGGTIALFGDEASWNLNLNNASSDLDALNSWMYIETLSGGALTNLTVELNGTTNIQQQLNGFYQLGTNLRSSSTPYRISGNLTTCDTVKLLVHTGYDCVSYPSAFDTSLCYQTDTIIAYSFPTGTDAEFQVNWNGGNNSVAFCAPFDVELTLNSTQLGDIAKLDNFWLIPFGFDLDQPNIQIEYPIGTGYRAPSNPGSISVLGQLMTIDYNLLDDSLAAGLSGSYDTTTKALKIRVPFNTSCGASSGDQITVIYNSRSACGDFLPTLTKESPPIIFTQAAIPGYTTTPIGRMDTIGDCATNSTFNFYVDLAINQVTQQTQVGDSIFVVVPPGVTFNSYSPTAPGQMDQPATGPFGPTDLGNGQLRYSWPMTPNLTTGDSIKFYFDVNFDYSSFQGCNQAFSDFVITTGSGSQVTCNGDTCSVLAINGRGTKGLEIDLPRLTATYTNATCAVSGEGVYAMKGDLDICNESGSAVPAATQTTVEFYVDRDESLDYSSGDSLIHVETTTSAIAGNNACVTIPAVQLTLPDSLAARQGIVTVIRRNPTGTNPEQCVCDTATSENFICNTILPVTIIDFSGKRLSNGMNELVWNVSEEKDMLSYELFKSESEDQERWSMIGSIGAKNEVGAKRRLSLLDETPASSAYYRLRLVNQDGSKLIHNKIVHITSSTIVNGAVMVYPNPTSGDLTFVYDVESSLTDQFLNIEIVDLSGRIIIKESALLSSSNNRKTLSTKGIANGTYILRYKNEDTGENGFVKFTKQ